MYNGIERRKRGKGKAMDEAGKKAGLAGWEKEHCV